jgi:NitT/TauT family transport system substrate-binding protein
MATKRALRAILRAADICATEPARAARIMVDRGFATQDEYTLKMLTELPYAKWREYDHANTMRFYGVRLREAGMIKATPQQILAQGSDWRFVNELKRELKG